MQLANTPASFIIANHSQVTNGLSNGFCGVIPRSLILAVPAAGQTGSAGRTKRAHCQPVVRAFSPRRHSRELAFRGRSAKLTCPATGTTSWPNAAAAPLRPSTSSDFFIRLDRIARRWGEDSRHIRHGPMDWTTGPAPDFQSIFTFCLVLFLGSAIASLCCAFLAGRYIFSQSLASLLPPAIRS